MRAFWTLVAGAAVVAVCSISQAAEPAVELFDAINAGQLQVRFQPRNERSAHVQIRNISAQPLTVRLPDVFAARPILAQQGIFGQPAQTSNRPQQSVAGPFGQRNGNNNQQGPNFFNQFSIAPERLVQFDVQSVCLEYGSPTPQPGARYELVPLEEILRDPVVLREVLIEMRDRRITQRVAQAAAWHESELSGNMTWEKLAQIKGELTTIGRQPYFAPNDLREARSLIDQLDLVVSQEKSTGAGAAKSLVEPSSGAINKLDTRARK